MIQSDLFQTLQTMATDSQAGTLGYTEVLMAFEAGRRVRVMWEKQWSDGGEIWPGEGIKKYIDEA